MIVPMVAALLAGCAASLPSVGPAATSDSGAMLGGSDANGFLTTASTRSAADNAGEARSLAAKSSGGAGAATTSGSVAYKVGPHDVLEITVFKVAELSRSVQVGDSGTVGLPLLGEVTVAGKTAREIENELAQKLKANYLQNPQVTVFVKEFNSQRVTIEGAVKKTGVYPLRGRTTLLQALSLAEGLDPSADNSVMVFRQTEKGRAGARFDIAAIRAGNAEDPAIQPGDMIVVGTSAWKEQFNNFTKLLPLIGVFALL